MKLNNQKGFSSVLVAIAVAALLVIIGVKVAGKVFHPAMQPSSQMQETTTQDIQSDSELNQAVSDVDNTAINNNIDSELNQNDADASTF